VGLSIHAQGRGEKVLRVGRIGSQYRLFGSNLRGCLSLYEQIESENAQPGQGSSSVG